MKINFFSDIENNENNFKSTKSRLVREHGEFYGGMWEMFGKDVADYLNAELYRKQEETGDYYCDNYRFSKVGHQESEDQFMYDSENGCCGSTEWMVEYNSVYYMLGYNHGH
jgi:hypothetical protein